MAAKPYLVFDTGKSEQVRRFADLEAAVAFSHEYANQHPTATLQVVHSAGLIFAEPPSRWNRLLQWLKANVLRRRNV